MNKIITFIRIFLRDKVSLLLGIGSLTIGISVSLMIGLWYLNEISYDSFHKDADNIYRICRKVYINNQDMLIGAEFNPLGKNITKEFPEVTEAVRIYPLVNIKDIDKGMLVKNANRKYFIKHINLVDTSFFNFFNYQLKEGSLTAFKQKPNSIIIDEQTANKVFPGENPLGKILTIKGEREVVAVMKNLPNNTHLNCHALIPIQSVKEVDNDRWGNHDFFVTYVKLNDNINQPELCRKMIAYSKRECEPYRKLDINYFLQPLKDIHLSSGFMFEEKLGIRKGNLSLLNTFLSIGIILLLIACVNFINLFISSAFLRAKAIGVKKINGAKQIHIIADFITETFLYAAISCLFAILICNGLLPYFSQFIGYYLIFNFNDIQLWIILIGLVLFISLFAGSIPGFYMSSFKVLETLKGRFRARRIIYLQKALVITQFTASIALLIGVFFINKQIQFINKVDLGFDKEQVVYINIPEGFVQHFRTIQQELNNSPYIKATSLSRGTTLDWMQGNPISSPKNPENKVLAEICIVQPSYMNVLNFQFVEGENTLIDVFGKGVGSECIINEKAGEILHLEKPYVGKTINVAFRGLMTIKGVIKNAYTKSLMQKIDPQVYLRLNNLWGGMSLMVKASGKDMKPVINLLRKQWEAYETKYPFEYYFLDKAYEKLYQSEEQAGSLALFAMGIALFLTIAGLWGMARYSSNLRTKEIGVRKVNGATIFEVLRLLNIEFIKWIIIAFVIAVPIAWYFTDLWLQSFMLQTSLSWWIFVLAGLFAITIAVFTITWQSWRTATRNPVEALRYE